MNLRLVEAGTGGNRVGRSFVVPQSADPDETVRILERRMALLEHQMETMETTLGRLAEVAEFHHELRAGASPHLPTPSGRGDTAVPPAPPGNARP